MKTNGVLLPKIDEHEDGGGKLEAAHETSNGDDLIAASMLPRVLWA